MEEGDDITSLFFFFHYARRTTCAPVPVCTLPWISNSTTILIVASTQQPCEFLYRTAHHTLLRRGSRHPNSGQHALGQNLVVPSWPSRPKLPTLTLTVPFIPPCLAFTHRHSISMTAPTPVCLCPLLFDMANAAISAPCLDRNPPRKLRTTSPSLTRTTILSLMILIKVSQTLDLAIHHRSPQRRIHNTTSNGAIHDTHSHLSARMGH